jgi:hypothetical protein
MELTIVGGGNPSRSNTEPNLLATSFWAEKSNSPDLLADY